MKRELLVTSVLSLSFFAFAQQTVMIPVPGATKLVKGDLYGSGARAVILTHGSGRTKESWRKQAQALAEAGFVVLAIDFRSDSLSDQGKPITVGSDADNAADILAAAAYLRAHGAQRVCGVGASMGGYALAEADSMSQPGEFDRIVLLATSADEGLLAMTIHFEVGEMCLPRIMSWGCRVVFPVPGGQHPSRACFSWLPQISRS